MDEFYTIDMHSDLHCSTCGRRGGDPWPEGFQLGELGIGWITEGQCVICWQTEHRKREEAYRAAVETLLGRFTDEQFEALKVVLRQP